MLSAPFVRGKLNPSPKESRNHGNPKGEYELCLVRNAYAKGIASVLVGKQRRMPRSVFFKRAI